MNKTMKMLTMSDDDYNKLEGYRSTDFKEIAKFGLFDHLFPPARIEKPAFTFGSMFHCMVLEPEKFDAQYSIGTPIDDSMKQIAEAYLKDDASVKQHTESRSKTSKAWKEEKAALEKGQFLLLADEFAAMKEYLQVKDKIVISQKEYDLASNMRDTVMLRYGKIIEASKREIVMTHVTDDGIALKAKIDCFNEQHGLIFDLKSTSSSIDRNNTQWDSEKYLYQLQAAFYETVVHGNGLNTNQFAFLFASKEDYRALMYKADGFFLERGRDKYGEIYQKVLDYNTKGTLPDAVMDLSVPAVILDRERGAA